MIRLVTTIVNQQLSIIGFQAEGKAKEFGELGTATVTRNLSVQDLINAKFKNNQISLANNTISEQGDFKIRNLPVVMFIEGSHNMVPISNELTLEQRVLVNGELKGFDVTIAGKKARLMNSDIINKASIFKPTNFVVRTKDGKSYIAGRPGMSLNTLPVATLTSDKKTTGKKATRTLTQQGKAHSMTYISPFDMITLCDALEKLGGKFIYLPGVIYNRTTRLDKETSKEFKKTGVEISKPEISYSEKKVNLNLPFNQIGQLIVDVAGVSKTYYPYTYRMKTVFKEGKLNAPYLGIAIRTDQVNALQQMFGASMSLSVITDVMTNMYVKTFLSVKDPDAYSLLALDTRNLSSMSMKTAGEKQLAEKDIYNTVNNLFNMKASLSYVRGLRKELESLLSTDGKSPRPLYGPYRSVSDVELHALEEAGIDIYTGAFIKTEESTHAGDSDADEEKEVAVEVAYGIAGMKSAPSFSVIRKNKEKALAKFAIAARLVDEADKIYGESGNPDHQYEKLKKLEESISNKREEMIKTLWLHNVACHTLGAHQDIKVKDRQNWAPVKTVKNGVVWGYTGVDASGLECTVTSTTII